jgi:hypothetical protein
LALARRLQSPAGMRWVIAMAGVAVLASCAGDGAACDAPDGPAYDGFRWACVHALPCATAIDCGDPRWRAAGAATLDAAAACLLGPCEARAPCMADAVSMCALDPDPGPPPGRTLYSYPRQAR